MKKQFYVYLLASGPCGWLYVGVTNDLVRRVAEHKEGLIPGYTAEHRIDQLVWYETHRDGQSEVAGFVWRGAAQVWARFGEADRASRLNASPSPIFATLRRG